MSEHTAERDAPGRRGCVVPKRHPGDAAVCATSCWQERIGKGHCPAEPLPRPPRIGDVVTVTGTVRTVAALWPDGHYRITVDVADLTSVTSPADGRDPVAEFITAERALHADGCLYPEDDCTCITSPEVTS